MHRMSSCLGLCAALFFVSILHTTNGLPDSEVGQYVEETPATESSVAVLQRFLRVAGCPAGPGYFKCRNGLECVSVYDLCDAVRDCDDGSDEEDCPDDPACDERSHGPCKNGRCVYKFADCTGRDSCGDGSRNENCSMCRASGFLCPNKRCIHSDERCTGLDACGDGSSNLNCSSCNLHAQHFPKSGRCIPKDDVCSGFDVSGDGESDSNCSKCQSGAYLCKNKKTCVRPELWCNGDDECGDNSSNSNCTRCRNMARLTEDNRCVLDAHHSWPHPDIHHGSSSLPAHHHFTYGLVIGVLALIAIVAMSVIALYVLYPSKFRWLHRRGEAGLVM